MTLSNGAGATEMAVSVQVLTVDGKRRMSHKFFEQIPHRAPIDRQTGELRDVELWGYVRDDDGDPQVVFVEDGTLYRTFDLMTRNGGFHGQPSTWDYERKREDPVRRLAAERWVATAKRVLADLPQLYIGG